MVPPFVGRVKELQKISDLYSKQIPSIVVIKGRRRIGKSRLVAEFAARHLKYKLWSFTGLAPEKGMTDQDQRDHFAKTLAVAAGVPPFTFQDWSDAFAHLSRQTQAGDIVLLDEISWMGDHDPSFVPKLKAWWDAQKQPITLVLCGSVSTWIEENILKSTAFFGRINLTIGLEPLTLPESSSFLKALGFQGSSYDLYKLMGVLGGVPWYLEQVTSGMSADHIIRQLCFQKGGMLVTEFDRIFHDLFGNKGDVYKKILCHLKEGMSTLAEVRQAINFSHSGTLSALMENLIVAGFVKKQSLWSFKTRAPLKQSLYYICDPYTRFYLKVIAAQRSKIDRGAFDDTALSTLPGFNAHIGIQLEYLLLQNRSLLLENIGLDIAEIVGDGPYRQAHNAKQRGCQVDYLVQTATKTLLVCEFKFRRKELGLEIIDEMKAKLEALVIPKGFAAVPVLFHSGGVAPSVETSGYFYRIINIADLIEA